MHAAKLAARAETWNPENSRLELLFFSGFLLEKLPKFFVSVMQAALTAALTDLCQVMSGEAPPAPRTTRWPKRRCECG
jgi:hypothetical protein